MTAKVLIAHGDTARLKQAVTELQEAGFDVVATPDGGDAFARFFEDTPDAVITAFSLSGLTGPNFARMVHSQSPHTPVAILLGPSDELLEEHLGFVHILKEPLRVLDFCQAVPEVAAHAAVPRAPDDPRPNSATEVFVRSALKRFARSNHILAQLDEAGTAALARIALTQTRPAGECVIRQGDSGDGFYLIAEGQVRVTLREKNDQEVARLSQGGIFGELAVLSDQPRSASVWTATNATLLFFPKREFAPLLTTYPQLRAAMSGVAQTRSEENMWRVLLADEDVQRSLADVTDSGRPEITNITIPGVHINVPAPAAAAPEPAPTKPPDTEEVIAPQGLSYAALASAPDGTARPGDQTLSEANHLRPTRPEPQPAATSIQDAPIVFAMGAGVGIVGGVGLSLVILTFLGWLSPPPPPQDTAEIPVEAAPAKLPEETAVAPDIDNAVVPTPEEAAPPTPSAAEPAVEDQPEAAPEKALEEPTKAAPDVPKNPESPEVTQQALRRSVLALQKSGDFASAAVVAEQYRKEFGNDWEMDFGMAEALRNANQLTLAKGAYERFLATYPKNSNRDDAMFFLALVTENLGDKEGAKTLYGNIVSDPGSSFRTSAQKRLDALTGP